MSDDNQVNPFAPPNAPSTATINQQTDTVGDLPLASQGKRLANFVIDQFVTRIIAAASGFVMGVILALQSGGTVTDEQLASYNILFIIAGITVAIGYFIVLEAFTGITIGKLITGTKVVSADGGPASFGQILGRSFARLIPFEPFSFLAGDKNSGWHDSLSGTKVVQTR